MSSLKDNLKQSDFLQNFKLSETQMAIIFRVLWDGNNLSFSVGKFKFCLEGSKKVDYIFFNKG